MQVLRGAVLAAVAEVLPEPARVGA
jgi:hypothetical protein